MTRLTQDELSPGLSAFLDPAVLLTFPACRSNARTRANLANRRGPFLLVSERPDGTWLCTPLLSQSGGSRDKLDQRLKSGPGNGWIARSSFYSFHQFWLLTPDAIIAASDGEFSPVGNRQRYAAHHPAALAEIERHQFDSDAPYRLMKDLP